MLPLNVVCTLSYIILRIVTHTRARSSFIPRLHAATTPGLAAESHIQISFTLTVMAKMNKKMVISSKQIKKSVSQSKEKTHSQIQLEEESWKAQKTWYR